MKDLKEQQKKKLLRLAKVADTGEIGILDEINTLDEKIDKVAGELDNKVTEALTIASETQRMEGKPGRNPLTVSNYEPVNPQIGDLWYKP